MKKGIFFVFLLSLIFSQKTFAREYTEVERFAIFLGHAEFPGTGHKLSEARKNIPLLKRVVLEFSGEDAQNFGSGRHNALSYLGKFALEGFIPTEEFFDVSCQAIKKFDSFASEPMDVNLEILHYITEIGCFGFHVWPERENLPLFENLKAFLIFLRTMKKQELILSNQVSKKMEGAVTQIQKILEEKSDLSKNQVIAKLQEMKTELGSYSEKVMDPHANIVTDEYLKGLIVQAKRFNP